jgi:hypothetical protein
MAQKRWMLAAAMVVATLAGAAVAVEEPAFKQVLHEGDFELREYPATVVAEVTVTGDQKEAASKGFRLLAGYIFGGNKRKQSIAMTAPVAQQAASQKIAMTAPVAQTQTIAGSWVVRFTMPSAYTLETLPVPNDARVELRRIEPARFAALQFSGMAKPADVEAKSNELLAQLKLRRLRALGAVTLAQYNPPWTLWFMRRNEVMVEVER